MAEEGKLGVARAIETDGDSAQGDLQGRIEDARNAVTDTVTEIKDDVIDQYNSVRESVTDTLDWREQVRKRPVAWSLGALGMGILVGYGLAGLIERDDEYIDDAGSEHMHTVPFQFEGGGPSAFTDGHSYAAHAHAIARVGDEQAASDGDRPGIIDRFKETRAYDRLQDEVSDLGNRFMDQLANAARTIVLPALFNKLKEIIGIDLSDKRQTGKAGPRPIEERPSAAEAVAVDVPVESGKAAYPKAKGSFDKFDRIGSDSRTSGGQSDTGPHINLSYDDRYERESTLFARGENRGFAPSVPGESKTPETDVDSSDRDDVPHGGDYTYEPGRSIDNDKG